MTHRLLLPLFALLLCASNTLERNYIIDGTAAEATAKVSLMGMGEKIVRFPKVKGSLAMTPGRPQRINLRMELDARALATSDSFMLGELKGEKFFHVAKHPKLIFTGHKMTMTSAVTAKIAGKMTARGITKPAVLNARFGTAPAKWVAGKPVTLVASATINRGAFGMTAYPMMVGEQVSMRVKTKLLPR